MGNESVVSCSQNQLKRELHDQEKRQMSPYIERSRGKLIKYNCDEWRMTYRQRRGVHSECVKFQYKFGEWVSRPRERPLAAEGISHLTGGYVNLAGKKAVLTG